MVVFLSDDLFLFFIDRISQSVSSPPALLSCCSCHDRRQPLVGSLGALCAPRSGQMLANAPSIVFLVEDHPDVLMSWISSLHLEGGMRRVYIHD
jgi:hypothetical protein